MSRLSGPENVAAGVHAALPRVLVVDDEQGNLDTFRRVFRKEFAMSFVASAEDALLLLESGDGFDIGMIDYAMRGMNGVELCRRLVTKMPRMARVLVTAHCELDVVRDAFGAGICHWVIAKPWSKDDVLRCVASIQRMASLRGTVGAMHSLVETLGQHKR